MDRLERGQKLRREHAETGSDCSAKTTQRVLGVLRNADMIRFQGPRKTGYYVLTEIRDPR